MLELWYFASVSLVTRPWPWSLAFNFVNMIFQQWVPELWYFTLHSLWLVIEYFDIIRLHKGRIHSGIHIEWNPICSLSFNLFYIREILYTTGKCLSQIDQVSVIYLILDSLNAKSTLKSHNYYLRIPHINEIIFRCSIYLII